MQYKKLLLYEQNTYLIKKNVCIIRNNVDSFVTIAFTLAVSLSQSQRINLEFMYVTTTKMYKFLKTHINTFILLYYYKPFNAHIR